MLDTSGIHAGYMMRYMYLKCIEREMYLICRRHARYIFWETCIEAITIHTGYIRDSCGIHAKYVRDTYLVSRVSGGNMYRCHHHVHLCSAPKSGHPLPPCVQMGLAISSPLELPHHLLCHGNPYPTLIPAGLPPWSREKRTAFS